MSVNLDMTERERNQVFMQSELVREETYTKHIGDLDKQYAQLPSSVEENSNKIAILTDDLGQTNAQLSDIPSKSFIKSINDLKSDGSFIMVGDSITEGYGLPYTDHYATKLFEKIQSTNGSFSDLEIITNMQANPLITKTGTITNGTSGMSKKSIILGDGASVSFNGSFNYIDIMYYQKPTNGNIEVYKNGVLIKTLNCNGGTNAYATTFPTASTTLGESTYVLKAVGDSVEIHGILALQHKGNITSTYIFRCGVSSQSSTYFAQDDIVSNLINCHKFLGGIKTYLLAYGTNDIYNSSQATTPTQFGINLEKTIVELIKSNANVILTVPPKADTSMWQEVKGSHSSYKLKILSLAYKYNLNVIDYSEHDFITDEYQDGVHPNNKGTDEMVKIIYNSLVNGIKKPFLKIQDVAFDITLQNGYANVGGAYGSISGLLKENITNITGTLTIGTKTKNTVICTIPQQFAPKQVKLISVHAFTSGAVLGNVLLKIESNGNIRTVNEIDSSMNFLPLEINYVI